MEESSGLEISSCMLEHFGSFTNSLNILAQCLMEFRKKILSRYVRLYEFLLMIRIR